MIPENAPHLHAVQFYEDTDSLCRRVAAFLGEGLVAGDPAISIARRTHQDGIISELNARLVNVEQARRRGDLVLLDCDDTLGAFVVAGQPDARLFHAYIGTVLDQVIRGRRRTIIRAYGEMVDVLWRAGKTEAAISLEILWNSLATKYSFSLLCGYSMGHFYKQPDLYDRVCEQHSDVYEPESRVLPFRRKPSITA
jgi:hypothetical protein